MILKIAAVLADMKEEYETDIQKWTDNIGDWNFFEEVEYKILDLKIDVSTGDRGDQTPPFDENAILADGTTDQGERTLAKYNEQVKIAED